MARILLIALGVIVIIGGLAWTLQQRPPLPPEQRPAGAPELAARAPEPLPLPEAEFKAAIAKANAIADAANQQGIANQTWSERLLLLVICLGGGVSILAGIQKAPNLPPPKTATLVIATAILGAASAVSTSAASHLSGVADKHFGCVDRIEKAIDETSTKVRAAPDAIAARQHLEELQRDAARCGT